MVNIDVLHSIKLSCIKQEMGVIELKDSGIAIGDILSNISCPNLIELTFPDGNLPCLLYIDKLEKRVSLAEIIISDNHPVNLKEVGSIYVDSGMMGISSSVGMHAYSKTMNEMNHCNPHFNAFDSFWERKIAPNDGIWGEASLEGNAIFLFESGYGDDVYPIYLLLDSRHNPTSLILGFQYEYSVL